jgi:acyl carrier protein
MTRETLFETLKVELEHLTGQQSAAALHEEHLLSQIINSSGFLRLLMALEAKLGITIEDEDFYEAAPVTVGDLVSFLYGQSQRRIPA